MKRILLSIAIVVAMVISGIAQITTDGLVAHWKFDEGSGTTVSDELGTTNGELVNSVAATWAEGYSGSALDFSQTDGHPAYARFDGTGVTDLDESFTMMFWVKTEMSPDGDTEYSIISNGVPWLTTGDIDGGWYHLSLKDGAIRFMLWDQAGNFSSPEGALPLEITWDANTWYHIAAVRDKTNAVLNVYLNGQLISTDADGMMESISNNEDLTLGSVANGVQTEVGGQGDPFWGSNYLGSLDEVQLYNVALTSEQIAGIYDAYVNGGGSGSGKSVAYVTKQKEMDALAWPVENDVIIQMLNADPNIDLTVLVTDGDGSINGTPVDLSGYDAIVAVETFDSGDAVWKSAGPLYLGTLPAPTVYNKMYSLRPDKALTSGDGVSHEGTGVVMAVDAPNHAIFSGIDVTSGKITISKGGAHDDGTSGEKCMQYNTGNVVSGTTMLGHPDGATDAVLSFDLLPAGSTVDDITMPVDVISFAMNQGQLNYKGDDGSNINLTTEGLTLWRNAVYIAAGIDVPTTPVDFTIRARSIALNEVGVYPNPAIDQITIGGVENGSVISVYSALGQRVASVIASGSEERIDVSTLKNGIYMVKVERSGKALVSRFVKK